MSALTVSVPENAPLARIGILTDTHIQKDPSSCGLIRQAFTLFRSRGTDAVVNVGDLSDRTEKEAFQNYRRTFDSVFAGRKPRELYVYAWHDRIGKEEKQGYREFQEQVGAPNDPYAVLELNGVVMLTFPQTQDFEQCEAFLQQVIRKHPGQTIFLFAHFPARGTVYNSCIWGAPQMRRMLEKYPMVIHISGHVHGNLYNELNIWQGNFTEVNAAGLTTFETAVCGWRDSDRRLSEEALILEVFSDKAVFRRFEVTTGQEISPETPWTIPLPFDPATAPYNPRRRGPSWPVPSYRPDRDAVTVAPLGSPCHAIRVSFPDIPDAFLYRLELSRPGSSTPSAPFASHQVMGCRYDATEPARPCLTHDFNAGFFQPGQTYRIAAIPQNFFGFAGQEIFTDFTMPDQLMQWRTVYETANPMEDCPMYTEADGGERMEIRQGFYIHHEWTGRMTFPPGIWQGPAGTRFRLTLRVRTIMPEGTQWCLYLPHTDFGRVYLPQGDSGLKTYIFETVKKDCEEPAGLHFDEGPFYTEGKLLLDYVKVETVQSSER